MRPRSRVLALLSLPALGGLACGDALPTAPEADSAISPATFSIAPEGAAAFGVALQDAHGRLLPALGQGVAAKDLGGWLNALSAALASRRSDELERAIVRSDDALRRLLSSAGEDAVFAADLEAVRLILAEARLLLESRTDLFADPR